MIYFISLFSNANYKEIIKKTHTHRHALESLLSPLSNGANSFLIGQVLIQRRPIETSDPFFSFPSETKMADLRQTRTKDQVNERLEMEIKQIIIKFWQSESSRSANESVGIIIFNKSEEYWRIHSFFTRSLSSHKHVFLVKPLAVNVETIVFF